MIFKDLRIKEIDHVIHFTSTTPEFSAKNRQNHIIGIELSDTAEHFLPTVN